VSDQPPGPTWAPPPFPAPPVAPGSAPSVPPPPPFPPEPHTPWKRAALVTGIVAAVVAAAVVTIVAIDPFGGKDFPDEWDARAAGFTAYVERQSGHDYEHPVPVKFLTDEDFVDLVASDPGELTDEDRELYASSEAQGRALGLFSGSTDVFEEQDTLSTEGILAFYSPDDEEVVVRLPKGVQPDDIVSGDDLPLDLQVTVVHELTHVLQDQVYDLGQVQADAETDQEYAAALGLIEGHAEWVAQNYVLDEFTPEEQDEYYATADEQSGEYEESTSDVTPVLAAAQSAPYALGPPFVAALGDVGTDAIDDAFADPPVTERELMQPEVFLAGHEVPDIPDPEVPDDGEEVDRGTTGATTIYFLLSLGLEPPEALHAVDGIAGDEYVAYDRDDGTACVDIAVDAADDDAAERLAAGFDGWVAARPDEAGATSTRDGLHFELHACDPGTETEQEVPGEAAISQLFGRSGDLGFFLLEGGYPLEDATCIANGIYYQYTYDDLLSDDETVRAEIDQLVGNCIN
jgi:hypothetical protein